MSFILDALKKSESERQRQTGAEFANVRVGADTPRAPRWLWVLVALLAINLAVLLGLLLRPDAPPATAALPVAPPAAEPALPAETTVTFADRVAEARRTLPANPGPTTTEPQREKAAPTVAAAPSSSAALPSIHDLRATGALELAELRLDMHVYSDNPADRFVFVNMVKHREGSRLKEGPVVAEIRTDGVVLEHRGSEFLLPRE